MVDGLSPSLLEFIDSCTPTYDAVELLLFLASERGRDFSADDLSRVAGSRRMSHSDRLACLDLLRDGGVIREHESRVQYAPASQAIETAVRELVGAYNDRPVTLIRAIQRLTAGRTR